MSILDWIYDEYKERLDRGQDTDTIHAYLRTSLTPDEVMVIWQEKADWIISNVFREKLRAENQARLEQRIPSLVGAGTFGERRIDVAVLQDASSIFLSMIYVTSKKKWMTYGSMTSDDWRSVAKQYYTRADKALARSFAAAEIADRIPSNQTTEEHFSESEFRSLLPEEGF